MLVVADFGGSFFVFDAKEARGNPEPLFSVFIGIPIRSIAWCPHSNNVAVGCVGGGLYWWQFGEAEAKLVEQYDHTINILRAVEEKIFTGSSDGQVNIFDTKTMKLLGTYKAHFPIHY
jgi:WD40 repeat protein